MLYLWHRKKKDELWREKRQKRQQQGKKLKPEKKQTESWEVFWVLLELSLAQGSQVLLQYNSKLQRSNIFRNNFISPMCTLKLSLSQYTGKSGTSRYLAILRTLPVLVSKYGTIYPQWDVTFHFSDIILFIFKVVLYQCLSSFSLPELFLGLEVNQLTALLWLSSGKRKNCSRCPTVDYGTISGLWYKPIPRQTTSTTLYKLSTLWIGKNQYLFMGNLSFVLSSISSNSVPIKAVPHNSEIRNTTFPSPLHTLIPSPECLAPLSPLVQRTLL